MVLRQQPGNQQLPSQQPEQKPSGFFSEGPTPLNEMLRTQSTCHNIIDREAETIFAVHPKYKNLPKKEREKRLSEVKRKLGKFLAETYGSVKAELEKDGVKLPPKSNEDLAKIFLKVSAAIWKKFRPPPIEPTLQVGEIRQVPVERKATVGFLFEVFDSPNSGKDFLDCKTFSYLAAQFMGAFGAQSVGLVSARGKGDAPGHALVFASLRHDIGATTLDSTNGIYCDADSSSGKNPAVKMSIYSSLEDFENKNQQYGYADVTRFDEFNSCTALARGNMYFDAGQYKKAIEEYFSSLENIYRDENAWFNLALSYKKLGQKQNFVLACIRYLMDLGPDSEGPGLKNLAAYPEIKKTPAWKDIANWKIPVQVSEQK